MLVILSGVSGAGKDTIKKELMKRMDNVITLPSFTSREKRQGETEGVQYHFISKEEFEEKIKKGDFLEYAKVRYGEYFGTPKEEVKRLLSTGKDVILEIDVQGAQQIKELFPETILIFIMAPSMSEVKKRIKIREK